MDSWHTCNFAAENLIVRRKEKRKIIDKEAIWNNLPRSISTCG